MSSIKFYENEHQYFSNDDRELISVSKFTKRFENEKNWKLIAKRSAAKKTKNGEPTTAQELLDKWERLRDCSADAGTRLHKLRENALLENGYEYDGSKVGIQSCTYDNGVKYSLPINTLQNGVAYPELIIYDTDYMISGQSDLVIIKDDFINIVDYKTDYEITFVGWSSEWKSADKLLPPLDHLDECNGNIYSVKMSIYMYLIWKANRGRFKPGKLTIEHVHLKRDDEKFPILENGEPIVTKVEMIDVPYRRREVIDMLKTL